MDRPRAVRLDAPLRAAHGGCRFRDVELFPVTQQERLPFDFRRFYQAARARGFILYPGKLTQVETFRVGCIGAIGPNEMRQAVAAVADAMRELGIAAGR